MIRKYGTTALGLVLLAALLVAAFAVPDLMNRIYDSRTLGQLNTQEITLNTYELTYNSFEEKLYTIGMVLSQDAAIELVELMEDTTSYQAISDEELTALAQKEVELLLNEALGMDIKISQDNLWERRLFTVFGKSPGKNENMLSGIYVYKLTFGITSETMGEEGVLSLYMDSGFHKIYAFAMENALFYLTDFLVEEQERISEILADYWELEQKYTFVDKEDNRTELYSDSGKLWSSYKEDILVFEDEVKIHLWRPLRNFKYSMSMNVGMDPFVYSF